jgi:hypothetical protein
MFTLGVTFSLCKTEEAKVVQVSISPTFYAQLFQTRAKQAAFLYLKFGFKRLLRKEIGRKAARKMLVKLTTEQEKFVAFDN